MPAGADPSARLGDPGAGSTPHRLLAGARAAFAGFGFALRHTDVLLLSLGAMLLYAAVWGAILFAAAAWDTDAVQALLWPRGDAWWQVALWQVARALLYVAFWLLAIVLAFALAMPVLTPLLGYLADRTEQRYYGDEGAPLPPLGELVRELLHGIGRSLALVALQLAGSVLIWLTGFVLGLLLPPLGSLFAVVVGGAWNALWVAAMTASFGLENNRVGLWQQLSVQHGQLGLFVGFGAVAQLLAWVPLTVPFLVVAATVLLCRLRDHGRCPLPVRDRLLARTAG